MASSTLCLIHCIITPFVFVVQACAVSCCESAPVWWGFIDFFFLAISFFAVFFATKSSSKNWIKVALYVAFIALFIVIVNEYAGIVEWPRYFIYAPAVPLVFLHLYNKKYCKCTNRSCCT
ncbi:MAG: MerC family mercury resistance protein [Bacteroidetes bacterium]|nr:MerC family mercury resistance protein [Bacteroidota bacterium]